MELTESSAFAGRSCHKAPPRTMARSYREGSHSWRTRSSLHFPNLVLQPTSCPGRWIKPGQAVGQVSTFFIDLSLYKWVATTLRALPLSLSTHHTALHKTPTREPRLNYSGRTRFHSPDRRLAASADRVVADIFLKSSTRCAACGHFAARTSQTDTTGTTL